MGREDVRPIGQATEEVLFNKKDTLAKASVSMDNLVSVNIFLGDMWG